MTLFNPLALIFFAAIPVVILMYILKQRSMDYTVPSLILWREALIDIQASSPWQKLRKNLLLLLQLLVLIFVIFALAKPFLNRPGINVKEAILVLDTSVSMQAADVKPNRFEEAKREISGYIENMFPGTRVTLISAGNSTQIVENMTTDKGILLNKLNGIKVTNGILDYEQLNEILRVMAKQYTEAEIVVYTDNPVNNFSVNNIKWVNIGKDTTNYSVTLLSHSNHQNKITGLSKISNFGKETRVLSLSLYADDRIADAKDVEVKAGSFVNVYWYNIPEGTRTLKCVIENEDILSIDNTAWDAVNYGEANKTLLVTERNVFLERALAVQPGIELYKTTPEAAAGQTGFRLYVYDGYLPPVLPSDGNVIVINPPEGNNILEVSGEFEAGSPAQTQDQLLNNIRKASFSVSRVKKMTLPAWGEEVLYTGDLPLLIKGEKGTQRFVIFGFDLHNTDLPLKTDFPILMNNIAAYMLPQHIQNTDSVQPGASIEFNLLPGIKSARVIAPGGSSTDIAPPFPADPFDNTGEVGVYTLEQKMESESRLHYFAVNVPSEQELDSSQSKGIAEKPVTSNKIIENNNVQGFGEGSGRNVNNGFNLQRLFIFIAFLIILSEWWVWSNGV